MTSAILLPTGTANEKNPGLAHLYEHLWLKYCINQGVFCAGFTTEDYVMGYFSHSSPGEILNFLDEYECSESDFLFEKEIVRKEIEQERFSTSELFFKKLWDGTPYKSSPLGSFTGLATTNFYDLIGFSSKMKNGGKYIFTSANGGSTYYVGNHKRKKNIFYKALKRESRKTFTIKGVEYVSIGIANDHDILYLIRELLFMFNPEKSVSFFEKKEIKSFVMETSCRLPNEKQFLKMLPLAYAEIKTQLSAIKRSVEDWALNELESLYYKNIKWSERFQTIITTPVSETVAYYHDLCGLLGVKNA